MRLQMLSFEECLEKVKLPPQVKKNEYLDQGKYPIVSQEASLVSGYYNDVSKVFKIEKPIIIFGDHTQVLKYIDFDFIIGADGTKILQPIEKLNSKYFYYYLTLNMPASTGYARHYKLLKKLVINFPSLEEQQRIVAKLEKSFAEIDNALEITRTNLKNFKALINSFLGEIINKEKESWEMYKLSDVCIVERGSSPRPIKKYIVENNGVNWIKIGDTEQNGKYIAKTKQKISKEGAKKSRFVSVGDFILTNSMSYGRPYIMKIDGCIHDGWFVLRLNKDINVDFFYYLLSSPHTQNQFKQLAAGSVVKNISGDLVKRTNLPIPTLKKQIEISEKIIKIENHVNESVKLQELKLQNLFKFKHAILSQQLKSKTT
jgi:type I restriction enzyme, S subunit